MAKRIRQTTDKEMLEVNYQEEPVGQPADPREGVSDAFEMDAAFSSDRRLLGAAYQRLSTSGQEAGSSLDKQSENSLAKAAAKGVHIPADYNITDIESGADPGRAGMRKLRRLVRLELIGHVFANDSDRLARDPWDTLKFVRLCKEHDVFIHLADGDVGRTIIDEAMQYFKGVFGFMERDKIIERTMDGKRRAAKNSHMPNGCGYGMFGYDYDPDAKKRIVNEAEAAIYLEMVEKVLGGWATNRVAVDLRERGIRTKRGSDWDGRTVLNLLRNEAPTGEHWWGTRRWEKLPSEESDDDDGEDGGQGKRKGPRRLVTPTPPDQWIRLTDFTPQIISPSRWKALQKALDARKRRGALWNYEFSEFFECGECGNSICGASQKRNGIVYPYYRCSGTLGDGKNRLRVCDLPSFRARELEPVIWEHIFAVVRDPKGVIRDLRRAAGDNRGQLDRRIKGLEAKAKKCQIEEDTLVMQRTRRIITQETLERLIAPITNLRIRHEEEIALLVEQKQLKEGLDELEDQIRGLLKRYAERLESMDDEEKQRLLRLLGVQVVGGVKRVLVTGVLDPSLFTTGRTLAS